MQRFECLKLLAGMCGDALAVTSAGAVTLEWNAARPGDANFRVRTLGLCSSIALGMALGLPERRVLALDGDGSLLMNLCSLPTIARMKPKNLLHVVFDNEVYEASGSKKTATASGADLVGLARAAGIESAHWANSMDAFGQMVRRVLNSEGPSFIGVKVGTERAAVAPYPVDEVENKYRFIRYVEKSAKIDILNPSLPASYS